MSNEVHEAEVVETGTELATVEQHTTPARIVAGNLPDQIVENAGAIATTLGRLIEDRGLSVNLDRRNPDRKHVEIGGWQAAGAMLGALGGEPLHAETEWSRRVSPLVEGEASPGWESRVAVKTAAGVTVGVAEGMCTTAEKVWRGRDDYALRSMAETRAESRAYRRAMGWVVELAGYSATAAEEMPPADVAGPHGASAPPASAKKAGEVLASLLGEAVGPQCFQNIVNGCGGYMPEAVAGSICELGRAHEHVNQAAEVAA